ncbi:hypothetical protein QR680_013677 [Steinernema hermaphroditum]|uniref:Uncharacterized protein n=1 Tax=Steinernema hermaphroditum TaxID=289476 RepID=A0AA39M2W9_9BILA|nr:hypothetical protein QR680_013677 [Steinernema hermaphroditum]
MAKSQNSQFLEYDRIKDTLIQSLTSQNELLQEQLKKAQGEQEQFSERCRNLQGEVEKKEEEKRQLREELTTLRSSFAKKEESRVDAVVPVCEEDDDIVILEEEDLLQEKELKGLSLEQKVRFFEQKNRSLRTEMRKLEEELVSSQSQVSYFKERSATLDIESAKLKERLERVQQGAVVKEERNKDAELMKKIEDLKATVESQRAELEEQKEALGVSETRNSQLEERNISLKSELDELNDKYSLELEQQERDVARLQEEHEVLLDMFEQLKEGMDTLELQEPLKTSRKRRSPTPELTRSAKQTRISDHY